MSLDQENAVDAIGMEIATNCVVLSIVDPWSWDDQAAHLLALQAKLNAYLAFIANGELIEIYPNAAGKHVRIEIISRYPLPEIAERFLAGARRVAAEVGIDVKQRVSEIK
jgi:hypothetical protein